MSIDLANVKENTVVKLRKGELRRIKNIRIEKYLLNQIGVFIKFHSSEEEFLYKLDGDVPKITFDPMDIVEIVSEPIDISKIGIGITLTLSSPDLTETEIIMVRELQKLTDSVHAIVVNNDYEFDRFGNEYDIGLDGDQEDIIRYITKAEKLPTIPLSDIPDEGEITLRCGHILPYSRVGAIFHSTRGKLMYLDNGENVSDIAFDIVGCVEIIDLSTLKEGDVCILRNGIECEKAVYFADGCHYQYPYHLENALSVRKCNKNGISEDRDFDIVKIKRASNVE